MSSTHIHALIYQSKWVGPNEQAGPEALTAKHLLDKRPSFVEGKKMATTNSSISKLDCMQICHWTVHLKLMHFEI
ncbi:hypothetical protein HanIR_Chr14g0671651 [Helianthus annuus]|nr:hypothetical protein HanIR_Chr14g0671651 [Helianthus annuus]